MCVCVRVSCVVARLDVMFQMCILKTAMMCKTHTKSDYTVSLRLIGFLAYEEHGACCIVRILCFFVCSCTELLLLHPHNSICIRATTTDARIVNLCSYVANNSFSSIIFSIILRVTSYFL